MSAVYSQIIKNFEKIKIKEIKRNKIISHLYKRNDFSDGSLKKLRLNFKNGLLSEYLKEKKKRDKEVPIITQDWVV